MVALKIDCITSLALIILLAIALAGYASGKMPESQSTADIVQNLSHKDAKIRGEAAWALGKTGGDDAVDSLITALEDRR